MTTKASHTRVWRRVDTPVLEYSDIHVVSDGVRLNGTVLGREQHRAFNLHYIVMLDHLWSATQASVEGAIDGAPFGHSARRSEDGTWFVDGESIEGSESCVDVDLGFTPATNSCALRRLNLAHGAEGESKALWLGLPIFEVKILRQRYLRESDSEYLYEAESGFESGPFSTVITVDHEGIVVDYPPFWAAA